LSKYDHIDFAPPAGVREEAAKGLEWRREYNRGGTAVGVARARDLSNGKKISPTTAKRMSSYFARHAVDSKGEGFKPGEKGFPSAGRIAWALWGGNPGEAWANKLVRQIKAADEKERAITSEEPMPNKRGKVKLSRYDRIPEDQMVMRLAEMRRADTDNRKMEVVIATENPVQRYDESRDIIIREVLEMDGIEFRGERKQMPIVDSHDRSTVANVLGSVRQMRVEGDELIGEASFASDERSQEAYTKASEGHLTDFSVTAIPLESVFVERGQTYQTSRGTAVEGPASIVTSWMPTDASICATGADERSVVRRSYFGIPETIQREQEMSESLRGSLVELGMPEEIESSEEMREWVTKNLRMQDEEEVEKSEHDEEEMKKAEHEDEEEMTERPGHYDEEEMKKAVDRALQAERSRQREIFSSCEQLKIERSFAEELVEKNISLDAAREQIIKRAANSAIGQTAESEQMSVKVTEAESDKFYNAAKDGLLTRAYRSAGVQRQVESPANGAEDFQGLGLRRMSEKFVARMGLNTDRMSARDIAMVAMGHPSSLNRHNIQRDAYHTTGSFSNLMLDAANKTLLAAYDEAIYTWNLWCRQATSVPDFKSINRIRFSEVANPEVVPENHDYPESAMSDSKESYKVEKYGSMFTVTWETVVNDDLDAISRIPAMQGNACRRKQNAAVYDVITANANLGDGGALFNTTAQTSSGGHSNLASSGAAVSVASLNTAYNSMMTKKGLGTSSDAILNIQPSYLIVPAAISATALQVVGSIADPSAGGSSATGNSNTLNIYGPNGSRPLRVVVDPVLDGNSATAWYLAASPSQIDTVELSFLQGEESPVLENEWDFDKDCYKYKVRQTFGVAAIDFRGLYKNPGA